MLFHIGFYSLICSRFYYVLDMRSLDLLYIIVSPGNNYLTVKDALPSAYELVKPGRFAECTCARQTYLSI